jgi:hypothetical protein
MSDPLPVEGIASVEVRSAGLDGQADRRFELSRSESEAPHHFAGRNSSARDFTAPARSECVKEKEGVDLE